MILWKPVVLMDENAEIVYAEMTAHDVTTLKTIIDWNGRMFVLSVSSLLSNHPVVRYYEANVLSVTDSAFSKIHRLPGG